MITHFEKCIEFLLGTWGLGLPTIVHPRFLLDCSTNLPIQHRQQQKLVIKLVNSISQDFYRFHNF